MERSIRVWARQQAVHRLGTSSILTDGDRLMPALPTAICVWLLALLLVGTSPFGMGIGVHRDQVLDPLFPHVHLRDGRIVPIDSRTSSSQRDAAVVHDPARGPALGAGTFGTFDGIGADAPALTGDATWTLAEPAALPCSGPALERAGPDGLRLAPPDPPPTLSA
jgi:hypothetical protein